MSELSGLLCVLLALASLGKLLMEGSFLFHLRQKEWTAFRKTAFLMCRPLRKATNARFILGVLGGVFLPLALAAWGKEMSLVAVMSLAFSIFALSLGGEFLERFLFFRAVVPLKMPGGKVLEP